MRHHRKLTIVATAMAVLVAGMATLSSLPSGFAQVAPVRVDLEVLVITGDTASPSHGAWTALLDSEGVPFDVLDTRTNALVEADLRSGSHAFYEAVVCSTTCAGALDPPELALLDAFQADFGIRRVNAYAWPSAAYGLNAPFSSGDVAGDTAQLTTAGRAVFGYLAGPIDIDPFTYGYYATPLAGASHETLLEGPGGASVIGVFDNPAGFEEIVMTIDSNQYQVHSKLLGHGMLGWVTRGVYLGYARNYFIAHFDDIFLPDDRWDVDDNTTYEDDGATNPVIRMVPSDVDRSAAWSAGNGIRLDFVYNGAGSIEAIEQFGSDPLTTALISQRSAFGWINHTLEHLNLDAVDEATIVAEIQDNIDFASRYRIPIDASELVTGEHSGLHNEPAISAALAATGITWIASDNSREPAQYPIGSALTMPRHPSNVYYNVGTEAELLDEYNYIYFENCDPANPPPLTTCLTAPATWAQYVDSEADIMLLHLISNDPRPHYFHQSNLTEEGTFYSVVGEVIDRYNRYLSAPLAQPSLAEAGRILQRTEAWLQARPATSGYYEDGALYLTSPTTVEAPVTGIPSGELYGGQRSGWVSIGPNPTIVPIGYEVWPGTGSGTGTLDIRINASTDDAEEFANGFVARYSPDLELVEENSVQTVGLRFTGLAIPAGARIVSAYVQFTVDEPTGRTTTLQIAPEAIGNAATFSSTDKPSSRTLGTPVSWTPARWVAAGDAGIVQRTPDLASVVQQVVDRDDWVPSNALALIITGSGKRVAEAFDGSATQAPLLHIQYETGPIVNHAPIVSVVGSDAAAPGVSVLDGTVSDDGNPNRPGALTTSWVQTGGPATAAIADPAAVDTTAELPLPGDYAFTLTADDGELSSVATVTVTATDPALGSTIEARILASADDVEEEAGSGWLYVPSADLELTQDWSVQTVGLRFVDLGIPRGATIDSAWIQFTADETDTGATVLAIDVADVADAAPFSGSGAVTSLPTTGTPIPWSPTGWTTVGEAGPAQRTPDLASVVQRVVDRADWAPGNAMALIVSGSGKRVAESFDGSPSQAPLLHIEYSVGAPVNQSPVVSGVGTSVVAGGVSSLDGTVTDDGLPDPPAYRWCGCRLMDRGLQCLVMCRWWIRRWSCQLRVSTRSR